MDTHTWDSCKLCMSTVYRPFMAAHMEFHKTNGHHKSDCVRLEYNFYETNGVTTPSGFNVCSCYSKEN